MQERTPAAVGLTKKSKDVGENIVVAKTIVVIDFPQARKAPPPLI